MDVMGCASDVFLMMGTRRGGISPTSDIYDVNKKDTMIFFPFKSITNCACLKYNV